MKPNPLRPLSCLLLLSSLTLITVFFHGWHALPAFGQSSRHLTDELVVQAIGSPNAAEADRALVEALRRGDRMFTLLLANKGDSRPFAGRFFERTYGDSDCSALISKAGGSAHHVVAPKVPVTVEVATLYLISAIYYNQRLDFAPYPHLMSKEDTEAWNELLDKASPACAYHVMVTPEEFEAGKGIVTVSQRMPEVNTPEQIGEAWKAVEDWVKSFKKEGLNKLKYDRRPPLGEAKTRFIYTSIIIGNNIEIGPGGDRVNPWLDPPQR